MSGTISRRSFLKGAALVTGSTLLAACGTAPTPIPPTATPKPAAPAAGPTATAAPAAAPAAAGATSVRWSHWWGDQIKQWAPVIEQKTNTTIVQEIYPWGDYPTKLQTQIAAGTAPDIIQLDSSHHATFYPANLFVPMTDALNAAKVDMTKWDVDPMTECGYKGKLIGLSMFTMQAYMTYVNLDLVKAAGYDQSKLPLYGTPNFDKWTWADFIECAQAVTKKKADGTYEQYGLDQAYGSGNFWFGMHASGRKQFLVDDPWNFCETKSTFTTPECIQSAQELVDTTVKLGIAPTMDAVQGVQGGLFRAGKAVFDFNWNNESWLAANLPFKMGYMHYPFAVNRFHGVGANDLSVNMKSKVVPQAQAVVIAETTDRDVLKKFFDVTATMPPYEPNYYLQYVPAGDKGIIAKIGLARLAGLSDCSYCTQDVFKFPRTFLGRVTNEGGKAIDAELQNALLGKKTVQQALTDAAKTVDAAIKDKGAC